ncbi:unnamed protein product [Meganyctiphanes norvegica]|uniref:Hemimethylated DNA-binding domain-containing protein n=1 Tax=Meganyctiphanes norvegica TaxID=48144 RepID=A0AAV2Q563_MEGNR
MEDILTICDLPYDVLERILGDISLSPEDVVNFSLVNKCANEVCQRNSLWRTKFRQHYPYTFRHHDTLNKGEKVEWLQKFIPLYKSRMKLSQSILALSKTFVWSMYHDYEWPDIPRRALALFETLFEDDDNVCKNGIRYNNLYILDECYNLINSGSITMNLTLKYYAEKVYYHIYNVEIAVWEWKKWNSKINTMNTDETNNPDEAVVQAQAEYRTFDYESGLLWLILSLDPRPCLSHKTIVNFHLESLVGETMKHVEKMFPDNPLIHTLNFEHDQVTVSKWKGETCLEILQAIHTVMRHEQQFNVRESLCDSGPENYCIDKVIVSHKGSGKLLLVTAACVARRLGVHVEVHKSRYNHLLGKWKLYYIGNDGMSGYESECKECKDDKGVLQIVQNDWTDGESLDSAGMCRSVLQQIVFLAESWLKGERWPSGEPVLYDLLDEETYHQPIRVLFTAWQHVEHWKMSRLYNYMHQLYMVSNCQHTLGKVMHLSILLRINSKLTLEKLMAFRRRIGQPPNSMRDLLRMLASVDKRARTRVSELKNLLASGSNYFSSLNPLINGHWPHGWPGGEIVQKRRVDRKCWQVQFAVGEVLEQRGGDLCVVYDWDSMCVESEDTLVLMGETSLVHGTDQPFFRVLTDGGSARYLAQENLRHSRSPCHLKNPLIGRYFTAFMYPFYIPNPQKAYEYPEDANIREQNALMLKLKLSYSI